MAYIAKPYDEKGNIAFDEKEHETWNILIERQKNTVKDRACQAFIEGLDVLSLPEKRIPNLHDISDALSVTNWKVMPVKGTILVDEFFAMLARREFPVATFIRTREDLDYLRQPDIFHEIFGHCPLLTNSAYADFVQWYGQFASQLDHGLRTILSRLFWFTIEFGLLQTNGGLRIYGGGILSSHGETIYSLESDKPARKPFALHEVLLTQYRYDVIQDRYFVIESLDALYQMMDEQSLLEALKEIKVEQDRPFVIC